MPRSATAVRRLLASLAGLAAACSGRNRALLLVLGLSALATPGGLLRAAAAGGPATGPAAPALAAAPDSTVRWVRGRVWDAYTQAPLPQASVWLRSLALGVTCDEFGYFTLALSAEQLAQQPADSLLIGAAAFQSQAQLLLFDLIGADSLLTFTLARDTAMQTAQLPLVFPAPPRKPAKSKLRFEPRAAWRRQLASAPRP